MIVDLRCEYRDWELVPIGGQAVSVASARSGRLAGDLDRSTAAVPDQSYPCFTWTPAWQRGALDCLRREPWIGAVRIVPSDWGGQALARFLIDDLAAWLQLIARPLLLDPRGHGALPANDLFDLATRHPRLQLIVGAGPDDYDEVLLELAWNCPNIVLESSGVKSLQRVLDALGAERVVFGSGYPDREVTSALQMLRSVRLGGDDYERMTKLNALALLGAASGQVTQDAPSQAS